ncbi:hypothetical protein CAOG_02584 [Capsaspora owczarzaki ATCC 30864]|uniref:hypothetical protein n=1 Tax=Capsaspora owczarzaki (strain ATCC 30864) TaxID=595528 RepID=UPI0003520C09|nr:hypothetical protein CAOG_02584 [Capsaspora owczarzaki ATCC 30864]|eukprot:XP_004349334.2 hypothetical protein CAOG_02584 [Capsaspora owczarzaki ATCC 30864]
MVLMTTAVTILAVTRQVDDRVVRAQDPAPGQDRGRGRGPPLIAPRRPPPPPLLDDAGVRALHHGLALDLDLDHGLDHPHGHGRNHRGGASIIDVRLLAQTLNQARPARPIRIRGRIQTQMEVTEDDTIMENAARAINPTNRTSLTNRTSHTSLTSPTNHINPRNQARTSVDTRLTPIPTCGARPSPVK